VEIALAHKLKDVIPAFCKDATDETLRKTLDALGNLADNDIRRRVQEFAQSKHRPPDQADELTALLVNLAHGSRFHTTHGTPRSSFLRCEHLLDQLLSSVMPRRRKGAPVAENDMP